MFVTPEFPSENPRIQNRNYPYTKTLPTSEKKPNHAFYTFILSQRTIPTQKNKRVKLSNTLTIILII